MDTTQEITSLIDQVDKVSEIEEIQGTFLKKAHELLDRDIEKAKAFIQKAEARKDEITRLLSFAKDYENSKPDTNAGIRKAGKGTDSSVVTPKEIAEKVQQHFLPGVNERFTNDDIREYVIKHFNISRDTAAERTSCGNNIVTEKVRKAIMRLERQNHINRVSSGIYVKKNPVASSNKNFFSNVTIQKS